MTNKLPEVGKRYKLKDEFIEDEIEHSIWEKEITINFITKQLIIYAVNGFKKTLDIEVFLDHYEELPYFQEKPEVQLNESIVSEVEKAKEELKYHVGITQYFYKDLALEDIKSVAQNLIDALDMDWNETKPTIKALQAYLATQPNILSKNQEETKKEEKPQSIWKPVSEEIDNQSIIFINKAGFARLAEYWNDKIYFIEGDSGDVKAHTIDKQYYGKKYCTLTDFINDIEQTKLDFENRLRKLEGNDI